MADDARQSGWLLAIDTSTEQAGVALTDGARTGELSWPAARAQTVTVLAEIEHLRGLLGVAKADIRAVGVATGPGTFTGLRVGVSLAKGLALAGGLPIIGVPTLDAAAAPYIQAPIPVVVVLAAGRGRVVWAQYAHADEDMAAAPAPRNTTFTELLDTFAGQPETLIAGELTPEQRARLRDAGHARIEAPALQNRRPGAVAALAWARWQRDDADDPMMLEPVYLHGVVKPAPPIRDRLRTG